VRATKRCVRGGLAGGYTAGMQLEAAITAPLGLTADAIEGKAASLRSARRGSSEGTLRWLSSTLAALG